MGFSLSSGISSSFLPPLALAWWMGLSGCSQHQGDPVAAGGPQGRGSDIVASSQAAKVVGEVVTGVGDRLRTVFQSSDNAYWFGSHDQGLFRVKGAVITRFTTKHGLAGNSIRAIAEDRAGNIIAVSEPSGVSRFDGHAFTVLSPNASNSEWRLREGDLWFSAGPDTGAVFRYDGAELHRLTLPKTEAGESWQTRYPRAKYPGIKYSPYDVYTIYKDSRDHVWFGTALLGACRYDGVSFEWIGAEIGFSDTTSFGLRSIIEYKPGVFWFCNTAEAFEVPPANEELPNAERSTGGMRYRKVQGVGKPSDAFSAFTASTKASNGDLWLLVLGGGVWKFDATRMSHYPVLHNGEPIWASSIYHDRQGVTWVSTNEHGLYRLNGAAFEPWKP